MGWKPPISDLFVNAQNFFQFKNRDALPEELRERIREEYGFDMDSVRYIRENGEEAEVINSFREVTEEARVATDEWGKIIGGKSNLKGEEKDKAISRKFAMQNLRTEFIRQMAGIICIMSSRGLTEEEINYLGRQVGLGNFRSADQAVNEIFERTSVLRQEELRSRGQRCE